MELRYRVEIESRRERETTRAPFRFDSYGRLPPSPSGLRKNFHPFTIPNNDLPRKNYSYYAGGAKKQRWKRNLHLYGGTDGRAWICLRVTESASFSSRTLVKIGKNCCADVTSIEDINEFFNDSFCFCSPMSMSL